MRKTLKNDDARSAGSRRWVFTTAAVLLTGTLVTACGGGKDEAALAESERAQENNATEVAPPAGVDEKQARLAASVADGKTSAPVDMKYDVLTKPELGQPFEVELTFETRLPAEKLEIEITEAPGLTVVGETVAAFAPVGGGQSYVAKVLVQGNNPGLFYIGVTAKMSTSVQTEARAFAIPIVIGDAPAAQKTTPPMDATGQAVKSIPAQEPK